MYLPAARVGLLYEAAQFRGDLPLLRLMDGEVLLSSNRTAGWWLLKTSLKYCYHKVSLHPL